MARRRAPAGQRAAIIRKAWLDYHAGRIDRATLTRVLVTFGKRSTHTG